tara:strand:- start:7307 stop:9601 length:2295 start_codon:yes stop_codon:yes gene_type:complete
MCLLWYYFSLPEKIFSESKSTIIESKEGVLLGAKIATDGQWRFPESDFISDKFKQCIIQFEDGYFYNHFGFNPVSIGKAFWDNLEQGGIKRGGSTITQQVIRLARKGQKRSYFEKLKELVLATRLEFRLSKEEILKLYIANAPFGGNVVGLEAASWRYYGRSSFELSWAENATLAVLPNAPSLIYPGKNHDRLVAKRDRLLQKLLSQSIIDSLTYKLAIQEELPLKPHRLPSKAPHLLEHLAERKPGQKIETSIPIELQKNVNEIVKRHYLTLKQNEVYNMSVLVLDVHTRKVLAYVGNTPTDESHQKNVNVIHKARSTGSILKPYLYAAMLDSGEMLPNTLIPDVPTEISSYNPKNFSLEYDGAVPASQALSRSLNIPAVKMLQRFGLSRFYDYLKQLNLKDIKHDSGHYGLTLILGGAESNLWDLCRIYAGFSGTLNHYKKALGSYYSNEFVEPIFEQNVDIDFGEKSSQKTIFDAGSIYLTYKALKEVNRPSGEENWEFFDSSKEIAWKTGTSFGYRDAWAIGSTKDYIVGVWVGNADGEGRPGLVGVSAAGPVLFDVFDLLPKSEWFEAPYNALEQVVVCKQSGSLAKGICVDKDTIMVQSRGVDTEPCPYHYWVHVNKNETYQVNSSCEKISDIKHKSWFVLPPLMEYYYKKKNPFYKPLPSFRLDCLGEKKNMMDFVYPKNKAKIYLPKGFDGLRKSLVLSLAHNIPDTKVYWYVDERYIGETKTIHEQSLEVLPGIHVFTVLDEFGNERKLSIEILK